MLCYVNGLSNSYEYMLLDYFFYRSPENIGWLPDDEVIVFMAAIH